MKEFDKIIGYTDVKKELVQIADLLKNKEYYQKLGVSQPSGIMFYGDPGVGKTLMATALVKASGLKVFTCKKDKPNGNFVNYIKETFTKAEKEAPSIVFLDDMDKFANGDPRSPDKEEYVTVQSCIDKVKNKDVFVIATVNNIDNLPDSLCRCGRFDKKLEIECPEGKDAQDIIVHYLSKKKYVSNVDTKVLANIMNECSCADLETVINEAGIYAGFERCDSITMDHIVKACMKIIYELPSVEKEIAANVDLTIPNKFNQIVYHEAGHTVIHEILFPHSINLVCVNSFDSGKGGFTHVNNCNKYNDYKSVQGDIITSLGGTAALDQVYGIADTGNRRDLRAAFGETLNLISDNCVDGFSLYLSGFKNSNIQTYKAENAASLEIERYYRKAKEILAKNREFLDKLALEIATKDYLLESDIQRIKATCTITDVAV